MMVGIYRIVNKANGKFYIGSSLFCENRKQTHFSKLKHNYADNKHLQNAWNKYGSENFEFEIIATLPDSIEISKIESIEAYFIKVLRPQYNKTLNTNRSKKVNRNKKDRKILTKEQLRAIYTSIEHREKMSIATKQYYSKLTEEEKYKRNSYKIGRVFSEATRKKLSERAKARKWSPEVKAKISQSLTKQKTRLSEDK